MKTQRLVWFMLGLIVGLLLNVLALASNEFKEQSGPRVVGGDGYLMGWDVMDSDGDIIASDPYIWTSTKEIEYD